MKKSFYVFLSSLLGMLLFILLQRSLFLLGFLLGADVFSPKLLRLDYITFVAASLLGLWYGIWVGMYWYQIVYEDATHVGMFRGMWNAVSGRGRQSAPFRDSADWKLEDLMNATTEEPENTGPRLEVFESNTVSFSAPIHADKVHNTKPEDEPRKRVVRRVARKSAK